MERNLAKIYFNPRHPAAFSSAKKLYEVLNAKYKLADIKRWLSSQDAYTLHKPARKKFFRSKHFVTNIDDYWQADLNDMRSLSNENSGFNFILTIIDVFSKFAWAIPLRDKKASTVTNAFQKLFENSKRIPIYLNTDRGKEFCNTKLQDLLKKRGVKFFTTANDVKASVVERFNRTLKTKMWKYLTHRNTKRYIDILSKLVESYNNATHSTIKMAPSSVNSKNVLSVWRRAYTVDIGKKPRLKIGDKVRITKERGLFDKGYYTKWSREIFVIKKVLKRNPPLYKITDLLGEDIIGSFYSAELQPIIVPKNHLYQIESILSERKRKGKKEVLVKWRGYSNKFNTWISKDSLRKI